MNRRGFLGTLLGAAMATMARPLLASTPSVVKPEQVATSSRHSVIIWGQANAAGQRIPYIDIDRACDLIPGLRMWNMTTQRWEPWR